ncbi:hypothetical protein CTheo_3347 [Ceratobasidium theobromae]|uniref:Uncharacterized protein n=1 Tax=Ceratobasidium theobromae TaxID=1582974 RepID=A0A5N5QNB9_9AGAM|nr:hypothetical protein CTheo_3347 [Ceratobasidium theobromae]
MPFLTIFRKERPKSQNAPNLSPQSEFEYVLPELDEVSPLEVSVRRRGLFRRPASEAFETRTDRDASRGHLNSNHDPLVPPPASVFAGFALDESDRPRAQSVPDAMAKPKGLFNWRKPRDKDKEKTDSFSLKSFRHVGVERPTSPPSSFVPPSTATRERVDSTGSEGTMAAGLFRQAARRSSSNLVEDIGWVQSVCFSLLTYHPFPPSNTWLDSESPRKSMVQLDDSPESPFATPLGGRDSPVSIRSDYKARSDSGHVRSDIRSGSRLARPSSPKPSPSSPKPSPSSPTRPSMLSESTVFSSQSPPMPSSQAAQPNSSTNRSGSPTKPRASAPATRPTRSPVRTTIPTKTNDGPSIRSSPKRTRPPSPKKPAGVGRDMSARSVSVDVVSHIRRPSAFEVVSRPKSPGPAASLPPSTSTSDSSSVPQPRTNYVPPPRHSSLALSALVDSDSDESPEEESESEGPALAKAPGPAQKAPDLGPKRSNVGAMRGRNAPASSTPKERCPSDEQPGLSRERTITQRDRLSPPEKPAPPTIGVSLFDKPVPKLVRKSSSSGESAKSLVDKFGMPAVKAHLRTRASHSTSAIGAAATARNSAAIAEANRALGLTPGKHGRQTSMGAESIRSHVRAADTDTDEDEKSESDESDDAPLSALVPARRPGSAASAAPTARSTTGRPAGRPGRPSAGRPSISSIASVRQPLVNLSGAPVPPSARPARRVPGVGVTRNSSLRGSRSVEDLGRIAMTPGSAAGHHRPGPRPFVASPPSSTGDSSSGKAPLTPRDGSESGVARRSDEARRKERRRSEAKASVDVSTIQSTVSSSHVTQLANVINGPGPRDADDDDTADHVSQMSHGGMGVGMGMGMGMLGVGWNPSGFVSPGQQMGFNGFSTSQSMPFLHPQLTGPQPMGFMPPPPPPGASEAYLAAHQQAMMIAKQTYLSAVAQQAMAAATEQWERSSNMGGSVYGGSQMSVNMGMMGMPMMGMYPGSAYAASSYEPSVAGGWGSASVFGGPSGARSVYAASEYGGRISPTKPGATGRIGGHVRARSRTQTSPSDSPVPGQQSSGRSLVPPSTWNMRRKGVN